MLEKEGRYGGRGRVKACRSHVEIPGGKTNAVTTSKGEGSPWEQLLENRNREKEGSGKI